LIHEHALAHFGPRRWWPAQTREEVIIGAVLTQNTTWKNVERAIAALRGENVITLRAVAQCKPDRLARLIRSIGYFNIKAARLQTVARWFIEHCPPAPARDTRHRQSLSSCIVMVCPPAPARDTRPVESKRPDVAKAPPSFSPTDIPIPLRPPIDTTEGALDFSPWIGLQGASLEALRGALLEVPGLGPETADSILLYALDCPTFVVDAYTRRIGARHGLFDPEATYEEIKLIFEGLLERNLALFNDYHAQLVALGNTYCRPRNPLCAQCPLGRAECFAYGKPFVYEAK
jgi:endonuclease III-like uncharacterized protein